MYDYPKDIYERRRQLLEQERQNGGWVDHWRELSDYILPRYGRFLHSADQANRGGKTGSKIVDGTATYAARVLASGMHSGLTSPARPWFRLTLADKDMLSYGPVRWWLDRVEKLMYYVYAKSNIYQTLQEFYLGSGVFGTAAFGLFEDPYTVIRCRPYAIGEYCIAQDERYRVNTMYHTFYMTTAQMIAAYGKDHVSDGVLRAWETKQTEKYWPMVWAIEANDERVRGALGAKNMPYRSVHYELQGDHKKLAKSGGFEEFPIIVNRWNTVGTNVYGEGPSMDALADVKMLQKERAKYIFAIDKELDPPVRAPETMRGKVINGRPGGVTYTDESDMSALDRLYKTSPNIAAMADEVHQTQATVNRFHFVDLFKMFTSLRDNNLTATEVAERHEEKLLMVGPVIERMQSEAFDVLADRTINILARNELLPIAPAEMQGMPIEIEYVGILAQAQKMVRTGAIRETVAFAGELASVKPDAMDNINTDAAIREVAEMTGASPNIVTDELQMQQERQRRAELAEQERQAQLGIQLAEGAKILSQADTDKESALTQLVGRGN